MENRQKDYLMNNDRLKFRVWDTKQNKYITNVFIIDEDEQITALEQKEQQ